MPRRNRNAWRNDHVRIETHQDGLINLNQQRAQRGKRGRRRIDQQKRRAA